MHTVASNTLWPEYEIINEDECEFDMEMSGANGYSSSMVSNDRSDETFKALLKHFEVRILVTMISGVMIICFKPYMQFGVQADDDKKSWTSFQECLSKAPEQVLR